jgi:DNA-binding XRE family transcriptional regulator
MARRRPTFDDFKARALKNPKVKAEYDALAAAYAVKRGLIAMRKAKGMTQEDVASLLGTRKSNISRLESMNSDVSPRLKTVESYARALGYRMTIKFEPERAKR